MTVLTGSALCLQHKAELAKKFSRRYDVVEHKVRHVSLT